MPRWHNTPVSEERNFLTPLHEAGQLLDDCKDELAAICRALHTVGNSTLADRLAAISADIAKAVRLNQDGADWALKVYVHGAEAATANMVNATVAALSEYARCPMRPSQLASR